ncbi:hypothetical protein Pelo_6641 [Pelomyxa schiedti]|nr:hypothetical protein Pelo_6641 [Pelomyxa schiedti]
MVKFVVVDPISEETFEGSLELGPLDPTININIVLILSIKNASIRREAETFLLSPKDIPLRGPVVLVKVKGSLNQTVITCLRHQLLETQNELRAVKDQVLVLQKQLEAHATMSKPSGYPTRTFVVLELEGHFNSNCAVITEARLHSSHGDDIPYCVSGVYDSRNQMVSLSIFTENAGLPKISTTEIPFTTIIRKE